MNVKQMSGYLRTHPVIIMHGREKGSREKNSLGCLPAPFGCVAYVHACDVNTRCPDTEVVVIRLSKQTNSSFTGGWGVWVGLAFHKPIKL